MIRLGVIGAGQIGHFACEDIGKHPEARVVAAADLHQARLAALGDKFGIERLYLDPEALLGDAEVDAVYIATPNAFHASLSLAALEQGKHVILEKPFALSSSEAEAVIACARKHGRVFTLGMNQRFREDSQKIYALARRGDLGDIYHAKAVWLRRTGIPKLGTWFGKKSLSGGGSLLDIGVHLLDLALWITDQWQPLSVSGQTYTTFGNRGLGEGTWGYSDPTETGFDVDDFATALIKFQGGASITLDVSWAIHQAESSRWNLHVYGSEAGAGCYPAELYRFGAEPGADYRVDKQLSVPTQYPHNNRFHNFINALLGREELCVTAEQALCVQRLLDAIYESSRTGREVRLAENTK